MNRIVIIKIMFANLHYVVYVYYQRSIATSLCVDCTSIRDADGESKKMSVVLSRKHALELEVK